MALTKKQRAELRMKFGGRCAYCGCELGEKWHADHVKPVIRFDGNMLHQERDDISNMVPACHPCNLTSIAVVWKIIGELSVMVVVNSLRPGKAKRWFVWDWLK